MPFNPLSWFSSSSAPPPPPPPPTQEPSSQLTPTTLLPPPPAPIPESVRLRKQLTLLVSGGTFLALSILTTRRSLHKRRLTVYPPFYHPNTRPPLIPPNGALDAFEALNLATLNTIAFAMLMVGGGMFSLDVCNLEELRQRVKQNTDWDDKAKEAEEEFEEWMVGVLARKERKEESQ